MAISTFKTDQFSYNPKTRTFSSEASDLRLPPGQVPNLFELVNESTGGSRLFAYKRADRDGSGEDTYGWWYESCDNIRVLIIND